MDTAEPAVVTGSNRGDPDPRSRRCSLEPGDIVTIESETNCNLSPSVFAMGHVVPKDAAQSLDVTRHHKDLGEPKPVVDPGGGLQGGRWT